MVFRTVSHSKVDYASPEALFNDLKSRTVPGLLSHQADVLRSYVGGAIEKPDVAFQLPTGSGKTLVGLLLAEWRRRKFGERALYLCPTRQLAHQVGTEANEKYGMRVYTLVGKKDSFPNNELAAWASSEAIVVTTFSGLFNVKPAFEDPQLVVIDDAHAAESYFGDYWSVSIDRKQDTLWRALVALLKPHLHPMDYDRMVRPTMWPADAYWVDKIQTPALAEIQTKLVAVLDTHFEKGTNAYFRWNTIRNHVLACHVYVSAGEVLIRPLIAPTGTHDPFSGAKQRVFMSATLGQGGDLERLTGRRTIFRIPVPPTWEKQGIGRRFFMFPSRSLDEADQLSLLPKLMRATPRTVMLVPSKRRADEFEVLIKKNIKGIAIFNADAIEKSKAPFVSSTKAVAILAARYDGIDFPGADCRLLVVDGLPKAANLQERFLINRMSAGALLYDRMMTRIVQAFGRCTRSATDYAAVIVIGSDVMNLVMRPEKRALLHPELQAELGFGLAQSTDAKVPTFEEYLTHFLDQDADW